MPHEMTTAIGGPVKGEYHLRGQAISSLIGTMDFVSVIWLAWTGKMLTAIERDVLNACFVACIDHGVAPPSALVARTIASCGKPLADAVAAGVLAFGPRHGNAAGASSAWVREALASEKSAREVAAHAITTKQRLSGFGHPEYDVDPRTMKLYELVKIALPSTKHFEYALEVSRELSSQKGKPLPLNVDGALGAVIADLDAPAELADALFLTSRTAGLVAHAREEAEMSQSYRRG